MLRFVNFRSFVAVLALATLSGLTAFGQQFAAPADRVVRPIDENRVVTLAGNVHPMARGEFDLGSVAGERVLRQMVLELEPSPAQQAELDALLEAQHDPGSPLYHHWLTPAEFGARFGASPADLARITAWLRGHGFTVNEVTASNRLVIFSGTAAEVTETFHTEINRYRVNGVEHIANSLDPQIPVALAGVVGGVLSLHDFRRTSQIETRKALGARPQYSNGSTHYLFPADWATIYDLNSLYGAGKTGTGVSIAIVGRSNINVSDVTAFRSASGLSANPPNVIFVGANPGLLSGDQDESTLDVEWSGATAPNATVKFVVGASTSTTDGVDLSAQYIVNHATAQVVSTSYGSCEQYMGATELSFYSGLWQQAASQGMSSFVSSGDSGAAGCDGGSASLGSTSGVNGLCSSPYATCVGGTEFNEGSNAGQYWSTTNSASYESALSYIPEKVWNESALDGGSGLWASTGGISTVYPQPSWQNGVPGASLGNGKRTVPDVSMTSAGHDGYIIVEDGNYYVIAGTSAASPSLAGVMALVVQSQGGKGQGNANPGFYSLLNASTNPFHTTLSGDNSVPGVTGFTAGAAVYNLATGLGSVDGAKLVSSWGTGSPGAPVVDFTLTQSATSGKVLAGKTTTFTIGVTESGSAKNAVALTLKAPAGVTATISPASITPGTSASVTLTVGSTATAGAKSITVTGANGSTTKTLTYTLTVTAPPTLTLTAASSSVTVTQGSSERASLTAVTGGAFTGNITWAASGLPGGVTAAWSANPLTPSGSVSSNGETLTLTAASTAAVTTATVTITAKGAGLTATKTISLQVQQAPGIKLAVAPSSIAMRSLDKATVTVTATPLGGMKVASGAAGSTVSVASGLPKGFTASWSAPTVNSAGAVVWSLTLTGSSTAAAGNATLNLSAAVASSTGTKITSTATVPFYVTLTPPTLAITPASTALSVHQGQAETDTITIAGNGTYAGTVSLAVTGLPAGVTAKWSSSAISLVSETGKSTLTLTAASTAKVGSSTITVTASGDGITATKQLTLQVTQAQALQVALSVSTLSMSHTESSSFIVTVTELGGLNALTSLNLSGLPAGVTPSLGKMNLAASGNQSGTIKLTGSLAAKAGTSLLTIGVTGASNGVTYTASQTLPLQLK